MCALRRDIKEKSGWKVLAINIKYNSTILAVFEGDKVIFVENLWHPISDIKKFDSIEDEAIYRYNFIVQVLNSKKIDIKNLSCVTVKGGILKNIESGTYIIDKLIVNELKHNIYGEHSLNVGPIIAYKLYNEFKIKPYMINAVTVNEMEPIAKYTGIKGIERKSFFHALSQKSVAKRYAKNHNKKYEDLNIIVAYLGSGITIGAHKKGRVVDVNSSLEGEGPFSPERSGSIPMTSLLEMCFNKNFTYEELKELIEGKGGCVAYFNNSDLRSIVENIQNGDEGSRKIIEAMAYQISKEIGKCAVVLDGNVDAIILTGGIAYCRPIVDLIKNRVNRIASVHLYAGKDELTDMVEEAIRILNGDEELKHYY